LKVRSRDEAEIPALRPLLIFFVYRRSRGINVPSDGTIARIITMGKAPVVPVKRKTRAPARRPGLAKQVGIVLGSGTLLAAAIGTYFVVTYVGASPSVMPSVASAARPMDHSGAIIVRATGGTGCRRMKFDNATGSISDDGPAPCEENSANASAASAASSSAAAERFGQISGSFQHK
jgi:hypothetical protein